MKKGKEFDIWWFLLCYKNGLEAFNLTDLKGQFYISREIRHNYRTTLWINYPAKWLDSTISVVITSCRISRLVQPWVKRRAWIAPIVFVNLLFNKPLANWCNIVGCHMLSPFAHSVARCCVLLGVVTQSLTPVKLLS